MIIFLIILAVIVDIALFIGALFLLWHFMDRINYPTGREICAIGIHNYQISQGIDTYGYPIEIMTCKKCGNVHTRKPARYP